MSDLYKIKTSISTDDPNKVEILAEPIYEGISKFYKQLSADIEAELLAKMPDEALNNLLIEVLRQKSTRATELEQVKALSHILQTLKGSSLL